MWWGEKGLQWGRKETDALEWVLGTALLLAANVINHGTARESQESSGRHPQQKWKHGLDIHCYRAGRAWNFSSYAQTRRLVKPRTF